MRRFPGRFLVLEGIDGAGTTSQTQLLLQAFQKESLPAKSTAEPSRGPIGAFIRTFLKEQEAPPPPTSMALLFAADRHAHLEQEIIPFLQKGIHVICDRYLLSSLAYQQAVGVNRRFIVEANQGVYLPDATFLLTVSAEVALDRRMKRNQTRELYEDHMLQQKIVTFYETEAELWEQKQSPLICIDGSMQKEEVFSEIIQSIEQHLDITL